MANWLAELLVAKRQLWNPQRTGNVAPAVVLRPLQRAANIWAENTDLPSKISCSASRSSSMANGALGPRLTSTAAPIRDGHRAIAICRALLGAYPIGGQTRMNGDLAASAAQHGRRAGGCRRGVESGTGNETHGTAQQQRTLPTRRRLRVAVDLLPERVLRLGYVEEPVAPGLLRPAL